MRVDISRNGYSVGINPDIGALITHYRSTGPDGRVVDWFQPAAGVGDNPLLSSHFVLLPFSNRINHGRFRHDGVEVELPANHPGEPHALHGFGWREPWQVIDQTPSSVRLTQSYKAGPWPWDYAAWQELDLDDDGALTIRLGLINRSDRDMPAGLGLHPYFPRQGGERVTAPVAAHHPCDAMMMPMAREPDHAAVAALCAGNDLPLGLDGAFDGWDGTARIDWPDRSLVMTASPDLRVLVLYSPTDPDYPFFCLEPVTHLSNAANLTPDAQANTGWRTLAPGQDWSVSARFTPRACNGAADRDT